jgi:aminoglycoside phosphotransferase family enzyme/predicted kinase
MSPPQPVQDRSSTPQESLVAAMMKPTFYPTPPAEVIHKETHISHVFLAGDLVYKVKKAVRYPFLDYSTVGKRRRFVEEELRLNRRLAPSVYIGIMPLTLAGAAWKLGGSGRIRDYALVMRRLPERRMMTALLESGQVTPEMMRMLAEVLAAFHSKADRVSGIEPSHHLETVQRQWNNNLKDLIPFSGSVFDRDTLAALETFGRDFVHRHRDLFRRRAAEGWIRDVHGDLHCEHICFAPEGIQIYDCIEFSPELRRCDLASEIAFLLMDLEVRGGGSLTVPFLTRYLELLDDPDLQTLLPFYKCYRALVRAKVEALRSEASDGKALRYFRYAARLTWEPLKPFVVLVSGLTGSGKSTLASELGDHLGVPVINSDAVRKKIAGMAGRNNVSFNTGIYNPEMTEKTYAALAREAEDQITTGNGLVLDATYHRRANREKVLRLTEKYGIPVFVIHCFAPEEVTKKRLAQREGEGKDISDGRWEVYIGQRAAYEPLQELPPDSILELNTEAPVWQLVAACEKFLRARLKNSEEPVEEK